MNRNEFITELTEKLAHLPKAERAEVIGYYCELIDDGLENGQDEEDLLRSFASPDEIVKQLEERLFCPRGKNIRYLGLKRGLLIGTCPVWLPLFVSGYAVLASLVCVAAALSIASGLYFLLSFYLMTKGLLPGLFQCGASIMFSGLSVLFWIGTEKLWKLSVTFTKYANRSVRRLFQREV